MTGESRDHALDHVIVVVFENRSHAVATDMDSPNPDTGEEHQHTNASSRCCTGRFQWYRRNNPSWA